MAILTRKELVDNIGDSCRETQIDSLIQEWLNLTIQEMNDPAWAMGGYNHTWSFNRRKWSFATVASTEDYVLPRDVDKLAVVRQTSSPIKLRYVPDDIFYRLYPYPTATGNPKNYRLWEQEGLSTRLASDGTIDAVSGSASDTGSSFTVSVVGRSTSGYIQSELLTLAGTTKVSGTLTYDAGYPIRVSKSGATTGAITITSGATTLLVMGPEERSPRFKVISLYPIPSAAITIYLEYYTRLRNLVNDADVPDIDEKWIWVLRTGTMAKVYQYQNKEQLFTNTQALFTSGVQTMVKSDLQHSDYIERLRSQREKYPNWVNLDDDWLATE